MGSLVNRKICLMVILIFTGLFITYTAYSVYAVNFWTFYPVSEHLKGTVPDKAKELYNDLEEKAEEYDTDIFLYENHGNASTDTVIKVYATGGAIDALKKRDIDNRIYKNPVTQNLSIEVRPLCDAKYIEGTPDIFYITKDIDNDEVKRFSEFFKQKYGYNDVAEASPDIGIDTVLIVFWVIVFAVLMMLAYYDVINCRKKNAVTVVLGGSTTGRRIRFVREYLLPVYTITAVYCLVATSGVFPKFGLKYLLYMIVVFSIVVVLLQSSMTAIDFKRDLSDASNIRKMLKISYCVRILVSIAGVTVLTVSGISIFKTIDLSEQRAFFEAHKDYDFYMIYSEDGYNPAQDFYNEFSSKALGYQKCMISEPGVSEKCPVLIVNDNAIAEMSEANSDFAKTVSESADNGCAVLISKKNYSRENIAYINSCLDFYGIERPESGNTVVYDYDISAVLMEDMLNSDGATCSVTKDPVIVIDYYDNDKAVTDAFTSGNDVMYRISDVELEVACNKYGWDYNYLKETRVNAYDGYMLRYDQARSVASVGAVLSAMILITQLLISITTLKLQYRLRAVEMVLRKIMGYSEYKRIIGILKISAASMILWLVIGIITGIRIDIRVGALLCIVALVNFIVEIFSVLHELNKTDAEKMGGVLKGAPL